MMTPVINIGETRKKNKLKKKDEIHLRYINLGVLRGTCRMFRKRYAVGDMQQVAEGQNIQTWELSVYNLKQTP